TSSAPKSAVDAEVRRAREHAGGAAHVDIREMIQPGKDAAQEILKAAASGRADLLVMGTRGLARSGGGLRSAATAVVRDTPCPLLLVPPSAGEEHAGPA